MFQGDIFGFRNELESDVYKRNVQRSVELERIGSVNVVEQRQEGRVDNYIRYLVRGGRIGNIEIAVFQRLNFRVQDLYYWRGVYRIIGNIYYRYVNRELG